MISKKIFMVSNMGNSFGFEMKLAVEWLIKNTNHSLVVSSTFENLVDFKSNFKLEKHNRIEYVKYGSSNELELMGMSDIFISDHNINPNYDIKSWQKYYNIWHGIPYKKMGNARKSFENNSCNIKKIKVSNLDKFFCTSSHSAKAILEGFDISGGRFELANFLKYQIDKFKVNENGKVLIVYTWEDGEYSNEKTIKKFKLLNESILRMGSKNEFDILLHHKTIGNEVIVETLKSMGSFSVLGGDRNFEEVMKDYEYIITDYSSVIFDCIFHEKKLVIDSSLINEYNSYWGVYDSVDKDLEKYKMYDKDKIIKSIMNREIKVFSKKKILDKYIIREGRKLWIEGI